MEPPASSRGLFSYGKQAVPGNKAAPDAKSLLLLSPLGSGGYGRVSLVRDTQSRRVFALKRVCKAHLLAHNGMTRCEWLLREKRVLEELEHPFIVGIHATYSDDKNLFLLLGVALGGELHQLNEKLGRVPEGIARFYASSLVLALGHIHGHQIVYRDLKPENVLLDKEGHIRVTDFGLAKNNITDNASAKTFCGTPEYLAPELILEKGHGKAVDYWAFGVLCFELLVGHSPFEAEDHLATYQKVLDGVINFPKKMPSVAVDLVTKLLQKDTTRRFGNMKDGAVDIKKHAFYSSTAFDWNNAITMRSTARAPEFNANKYDWKPAQMYLEDKPCSKDDNALFAGFECT